MDEKVKVRRVAVNFVQKRVIAFSSEGVTILAEGEAFAEHPLVKAALQHVDAAE